jgi:hypothetical protein
MCPPLYLQRHLQSNENLATIFSHIGPSNIIGSFLQGSDIKELHKISHKSIKDLDDERTTFLNAKDNCGTNPKIYNILCRKIELISLKKERAIILLEATDPTSIEALWRRWYEASVPPLLQGNIFPATKMLSSPLSQGIQAVEDYASQIKAVTLEKIDKKKELPRYMHSHRALSNFFKEFDYSPMDLESIPTPEGAIEHFQRNFHCMDILQKRVLIFRATDLGYHDMLSSLLKNIPGPFFLNITIFDIPLDRNVESPDTIEQIEADTSFLLIRRAFYHAIKKEDLISIALFLSFFIKKHLKEGDDVDIECRTVKAEWVKAISIALKKEEYPFPEEIFTYFNTATPALQLELLKEEDRDAFNRTTIISLLLRGAIRCQNKDEGKKITDFIHRHTEDLGITNDDIKDILLAEK